MNELLTQILAGLNLQPGECQRVQVNGYHLEIRRPVEEESGFAGQVMLDPWVTLKQGEPATSRPVRAEPHPLPIPPEIPSDEVGAS